MIRHYTLPVAEVDRVIAAGGPLADLHPSSDALKAMSIAVVEVDGRIVAYWVAWYALHTEPLWVHPDFRTHAGVNRGLVSEMQAIVEATGEASAFAVIHDQGLEQMVPYAQRLGFYEAPGKLFYVVLEPAQAVVGG